MSRTVLEKSDHNVSQYFSVYFFTTSYGYGLTLLACLAGAVQAAYEYVQAQGNVNIDETSFAPGRENAPSEDCAHLRSTLGG